MGRLIDDMLKLSRVTRSEFHHESVDLSTMVREISEKLQQNDPDRTVDVIIREGVFVQRRPLFAEDCPGEPGGQRMEVYKQRGTATD